MSDEIKHENGNGHGSYERQDLRPSGILYFLLALAFATLFCAFALKGVYALLEHRQKSLQPPVSPLVSHVPSDTRHVPAGYPHATFPDPKLEEDERGQLDGIRMREEQTMYSYGWVDEKAGTVHIPIERAMDLLVQRGLPVRPQGSENSTPAIPEGSGTHTKDRKK